MKIIIQLLKAVILSFLLMLSIPSQAQNGRPNVILIIADDLRYDAFNMTGGPSFLNTPSINKIANEGARFDNFFCVYPLCVPSRATLMTGLYPHSHGAVDNCTSIKPSIKTLAQILDSAGYHTGMIGKYHIATKVQKGWDYWFATARKIDYVDPTFYFNKTEQDLNGNVEQILYDTVHQYLSNVDTPFFVTIGHIAPHRPCKPLPQYLGVLEDETMPVPDNYFKFSKWYPSYLYQDTDKIYDKEKALENDYEDYYEGLLGIEDNVSDIFNILQDRALLNKTMIIFLSDNGAIYGEHMLKGKGKAYEPSVHVPLFIRYPTWYAPNTVIDGNFFCLNIDIMPTILDAVKINVNKYHPQGVSLQKLISGQVQRDAFLFENIKLAKGTCDGIEDSDLPSMRGAINKNYKYIWAQCDHLTEELFDIVNDPLETTNLVHEPGYANVLNDMRDLLDDLKVQYYDTLKKDKKIEECCLVKSVKDSLHYIIVDDILPFKMSPNPATETVNIFGEFDVATSITITNLLGEIMYYVSVPPQSMLKSEDIGLTNFPPGIYFVAIRQEGNLEVKTLLKE